VRVNGRLNQFQYMDIIHEHLLPFIEDKHGGNGNFFLLKDNCRPHRALKVGKYMALHGVERLDWAPQSPDMNAIEPLRTCGPCSRRVYGPARSPQRPWTVCLMPCVRSGLVCRTRTSLLCGGRCLTG